MFRKCLKFIGRLFCVVLSGLLLSSAFAPLELFPFAWIAFVPLVLLSAPRTWTERLFWGFVFGYAHFCTTLQWLNEVGFGAGWLLAIYCALYPMVWYALFSAFIWKAKDMDADTRNLPKAGLLSFNGMLPVTTVCCASAFLWIALEWIRANLFTGFAWNLLGIAQATFAFEGVFPYQDHPIGFSDVMTLAESIDPSKNAICSLATFGGVYAVSFVIIVFNLFVASLVARIRLLFRKRFLLIPWHLAWAGLVCLIAFFLIRHEIKVREAIKKSLCEPSGLATIGVLAMQGRMPQCRAWTREDVDKAWGHFAGMTTNLLSNTMVVSFMPDVIIWPECAVPCPIIDAEYRARLADLLATIKTPILLGAIDERLKDTTSGKDLSKITEDDIASFNSVFLLDETSELLHNPLAPRINVYDKIHLVPFGEFTPGSKYMPWLAKLIGMGRDLDKGHAYSLFKLSQDIQAGTNICFEDVFPDISREFTLAGADLLITVTNDSWYNDSSAGRQHLAHAVFRAIENRRPLVRSANYSESCIINFDGSIHNTPFFPYLKNDEEYNEFMERHGIESDYASCIGDGLYVPRNAPLTFYTRHGDVFALLCLLAALAPIVWLVVDTYRQKRKNLAAIKAK